MREGDENSLNSNEAPFEDGSDSSKNVRSESSDNENGMNNTETNSKHNKKTLSSSNSSSVAVNNTQSSKPNVSNQPVRSSRDLEQSNSLQFSNTHNSSNSQSSQAKKEQALQDEATRLFCEMASDPDIMDQAFSAAVNPNVAMELARQADTAWRNIETLPGGFRALCQMHHNLQQPLWNAVIGQDLPKISKYTSNLNTTLPNEPIKAEPMPNPWKTESQPRNVNPVGQPTFNTYNPFGFSNVDEPLPVYSRPSSQGSRDELLSSVISRTRSASFQTASQLIQNSSNKYSKEMEELAEMGITDREKCLTALEAADGDLFQALGILQNLEEIDKEENNKK